VRPVEVCASGEVRVPTAIGFFHPVILIPEWAVSELSADELRTIVLHEFAHLRRWDDWTNLLQKTVRSVFFFHPAVLWIERRLSLEREMACDDAVLAETENPHLYARCLVSLAERSFLRRSIAVAQAAISRAKDTSLRLAQILDHDRPKATRVFSPAVAAVAAFAGLCFVAIPNAPRLIAFRSPTAPAVQSQAPSTLAAETDAPELASYLPKAMVIPAAIHTPVAAQEQRATRVKTAVRRVRKPMSAVHEVLAKQRPSMQKPTVVQAELKQPALPAPQFVIFTQSTEFFRVGPNVMTYSVWRVTLVTGRNVASKAAHQT
jgi:type IV secretory pathway VirJ component